MLEELKQCALEANLLLSKHGLITFTQGNISGIDRDTGTAAIKPSGAEYDHMTAQDIVLYSLDGSMAEGKLKPSSDLMTHLAFYKSFPDVGGAARTYSRWAIVLAQAGRAIPASGTTQVDYFYGDIPCTRLMSEAEIHGEYELETGHVIVETFIKGSLNPDTMPGVLVYSHGPFAWGKDPFEAMHNAVVTEECATAAFVSIMLQDNAVQPTQQVSLDKHFKRKHGPNAYRGQQTL